MQKTVTNTKNEQYRPCYLYCTVATTIIDINDKRDDNENVQCTNIPIPLLCLV
jgi:hypothetical protein